MTDEMFHIDFDGDGNLDDVAVHDNGDGTYAFAADVDHDGGADYVGHVDSSGQVDAVASVDDNGNVQDTYYPGGASADYATESADDVVAVEANAAQAQMYADTGQAVSDLAD
jgi:hypothetical protein